jgi:transcriptional regulator GlxA family with amidase domain
LVLTNAYALRGLAKFGLVSYAESTNITTEVAAPTREEIASSLWQKDLSITNLPQQASARGAQMAKYCRGVRAFRFTRSFRNSFGTSAHRYLIQQRIRVAKALLLETSSPLSQVAVQAGFSDQAALSRTFERMVGVPPGRWRRERSGRNSSSRDFRSAVIQRENYVDDL